MSNKGGESVLDKVEFDEQELGRKAEAAFSLKLSGKKKALLAVALGLAFLISFCLGRYSTDLVGIVQAIGEHFAATAWWLQGLPDAVAAVLNGNAADLGERFAPLSAWWTTFDNYPFTDIKMETALFNIRFPRIIVVLLVGAALSVAGASYQGMFKNPLVSPDLLGASAGASFGACLAMLMNCPNSIIQLLAFAGGMVAVGCVVMLNKAIRADAMLGLILGGILVGTLFQSGTSIIKLVADADDKLPAITFWLMGSFASTTLADMITVLPVMLAGFLMLMSQRWKLNVLSFGEEEARSLGVNTSRTRIIVIFAATLLTSCSVAVAGIVGYVGLVVPHLARAIVGPNYRLLLPTTMVVGSVFLLIVDNVARMLFAVEIPIGLLTSIVGVPFFIFIYRKNMKGW